MDNSPPSAFRDWKIAVLNDYFRMTFDHNLGHAIISREINQLDPQDRQGLIKAVKNAHEFPPLSDPDGHHDCGIVSFGDHEAIWRMEYYGQGCQGKSNDPSDLTATYRVLRIMLPQEWQAREILASPTLSVATD